MSLYFIALLPDPELLERIQLIKEEVAEKHNSRHSLKLPAHITLQPPFKKEEEEEANIIKTLRELVKEQEKFDVKLRDFGSFPPRVIYIDIVDIQPVVELHQRLIIFLKKYKIVDATDPKFHPHVTVATRDLTVKDFKVAWPEFKTRKFTADWKVEKIYLFKHNGKVWKIWEDFQFGNN